ncbi:MAG: gliding motility-associated-like protein [Flavobacteriales bacterium]|jgi:gliding motility-associated-like protein
MNKMKFVISLICAFCLSNAVLAQAPINDSLVNAIPICPNIEYQGTNKYATPDSLENINPAWDNECNNKEQNTVWYKFKTNHEIGYLQIKFSNISCLLAAGKSDSLEAMIIDFDFDSSKPQEAYNSGCSMGKHGEDFVVSSDFPLKPLHEYYLVIDGVHDFNTGETAECDFTLELSGESADINIVTIPVNASRSLLLGQRLKLNAIGASGDKNNVAWTPRDLNVIEDPNSKITYVFPVAETTTYRVVSRNSFYSDTLVCTLTDSIVLYVNEQLNPYNTFTPNGDGFNDLWVIPKIDEIDEFKNAEVTVFNRWGQIVYKVVGYDNNKGWDGYYKGSPVPEATYYWIIKLNDFFNNNGKYAGSVTIIR